MKCIKTEILIGKMRLKYSVVKVLLQVELSVQTKLEEVSEDQKEVGGEVGAGGVVCGRCHRLLQTCGCV